MVRMDFRSFPALAVFGTGLILALIANFKLKHVHVRSPFDAITTMSNGELDFLILWICVLLGNGLLIVGVFMMMRLSWENIRYSDYDSNSIINIIITLIMIIVTLVSVYYAALAVMGLLIIMGIIALLASNKK